MNLHFLSLERITKRDIIKENIRERKRQRETGETERDSLIERERECIRPQQYGEREEEEYIFRKTLPWKKDI